MAEGNGLSREDGKRYTDVNKEPDKPLPPLQKFTSQPPLKLEDAVRSLQKFIEDLEKYVKLSLDQCRYPKDDLSQNESAALYLYSLQWPKEKVSFYTMFNRALRNEDRTKLVPYSSYLQLFMITLEKLPSNKRYVWRGVNGDISDRYKADSVHVWWGASSCSDNLNIAASFLEKDEDQTMFNIECYNGKSIKNHSAFPNENEIVLPPGTCLKVKGVWKASSKAHIVQMEQIPYEESSVKTAASSSASNNESQIYLIWLDNSVNQSKENIETQKQLQNLNVNFKTFEQPDQCENFIDQITTNSPVILIVGGQMGRQFVPKVHHHIHLTSIFVFCMNKVENEKWAKSYTKVKTIFISVIQ